MTNREEVAKKLREAGKELDNTFDKSDDGDEFLAAFIAIDLAIGQPKRSPFEFSPFFNRLADLIDPTRELKIQDGHACCGNCGHILAGEYESEEDYWCFRPYCPDCGTRVVRRNDQA